MQVANLIGVLLVIAGAIVSITGIGAVVGLPMVGLGVLLIILNAVLKGGVSAAKTGASAVSGGRPMPGDKNNGLYGGSDMESISGDSFTYYDFEIPDYGYKKGKVEFNAKTLSPGEVDFIVVSRKTGKEASPWVVFLQLINCLATT